MGKSSTLRADVKSPPDSSLPAMFARYRYALDGELRAAMPVPTQTGQQLEPAQGDGSDNLYHMLRYHMGWDDVMGEPLLSPSSQGKALRPTLCLFASEAADEEWTRALPVAAALEFIHNFSLIHDDIQDGDIKRRHQPTVWALWGQPQALVAGNAMRTLADLATLRMTERGVPVGKGLRASSVLTRGYLDMTKGQCLDLAFEGSLEIGLDEYITMISFKTGALIRCGMEMGTLVASDDESLVQAFTRCGSFLGLAFQIRDDVLGIWGDEEATGKAVGNDILRKKKSFPIVYALQSAGDVARRRMVDAYSKETLEEGDVADVLEVLDGLDAAGYAQQVTCEKADLSLKAVADAPLPSWAHREFEELVEFLTTRQY